MTEPIDPTQPETPNKPPKVDGLDPREITRDLEARVPSLKLIPEQDRLRAVEVIVEEAALFSGPLPPPSMLQKYNDILPGLADRITKMAEHSLEHSQATNTKIIDSEISAQSRDHIYRLFGMFIGFMALVGMLGLVGWLAFINQPWLAGTLGFTSIAVIVGLFIHGKPDREKPKKTSEVMSANSSKKSKKNRR